jgi:hypothetical protein
MEPTAAVFGRGGLGGSGPALMEASCVRGELGKGLEACVARGNLRAGTGPLTVLVATHAGPEGAAGGYTEDLLADEVGDGTRRLQDDAIHSFLSTTRLRLRAGEGVEPATLRVVSTSSGGVIFVPVVDSRGRVRGSRVVLVGWDAAKRKLGQVWESAACTSRCFSPTLEAVPGKRGVELTLRLGATGEVRVLWTGSRFERPSARRGGSAP